MVINNIQELLFNPSLQLNTIIRYSHMHQLMPENVAEHTYHVCMISLFIANEIKKTDSNLSIESVLIKALLHDVEESLLGDIPRITKHYSSETTTIISSLENQVVKQILPDFLIKYWETAKSGLDGDIVRVADVLSVIRKTIYEYNIYGNKVFWSVIKQIGNLVNHYRSTLQLHPYLDKLLADSKLLIDNINDNDIKNIIDMNIINTSNRNDM